MNTTYNVIYHHGILGQKWGKKNGPPYPLGASDHSVAERKAGTSGWSKDAKKQNTTSKTEQEDKSSFNYKKAVKIGATVAGTALVAYGGYYLYKSGAINNLVKIGKNAIQSGKDADDRWAKLWEEANDIEYDYFSKYDNFSNVFGNITDSIKSTCEKSNIKIRDVIDTADNDCINMANPKYSPNNFATSNNCVQSSIAFCMERLGMNVTAKPLPTDRFDHGFKTEEVNSVFKGLLPDKVDFSKISNAKDAEKHLTKSILEICDDEHNVGMFTIKTQFGGHDMAWEKMAGSNEVKFYDPAKRSTDMSKYFTLLGMDVPTNVFSYRLDDCIIDGDKLLDLFVDKL